MMYLVANISNLISANKLRQAIGVKSATTVLEYLSFMQEAYLIQLMPKFSFSYKTQLVNPRKLYFVDNGLYNAITPSGTKDNGRRLENFVFWELRRVTSELFYYNENGMECDFVVCRNNQPEILIQVCLELTGENRHRELNGMMDAMNFYGIENGYIITLNQTDKITMGERSVTVLPAHQINFKKFLNR